jgi:uncharacterized RDD family membrane protein YckC
MNAAGDGRYTVELAGPVARLLAWLVDFGCKAVILSTLGVIASLLGVVSKDIAAGVYLVAAFLVVQGYQIALEYAWRGQTIGKRLLNLRVMDEQGLRLTFSQVVMRNLLRVADQLPSLYLTGGIAMVLSARRQRLGDLAANTIVVRTGAGPGYALARDSHTKYNSFRAFPHLEARLRQRVDPAVAALAMQALHRRDTLETQPRLSLMHDLAEYFRGIVRFPEEATVGITDEQYLRNALDSMLHRDSGR